MLKVLNARIDEHVSKQGGNSRLAGGRNTGNLVVSYGPGRGEFQSVSCAQAQEYLVWLDAGNVGGPWQAGIT